VTKTRLYSSFGHELHNVNYVHFFGRLVPLGQDADNLFLPPAPFQLAALLSSSFGGVAIPTLLSANVSPTTVRFPPSLSKDRQLLFPHRTLLLRSRNLASHRSRLRINIMGYLCQRLPHLHILHVRNPQYHLFHPRPRKVNVM
jgi:hypothetical protein